MTMPDRQLTIFEAECTIDGVPMDELTEIVTGPLPPRSITLSLDGDTFVLLDVEDYEWASQFKWRWKHDKHRRKKYAVRNTWVAGTRVTLYLHKEILIRKCGHPRGTKLIGDHRNGDSLDCRRKNLRWATKSQNNANRKFNRCNAGRFI